MLTRRQRFSIDRRGDDSLVGSDRYRAGIVTSYVRHDGFSLANERPAQGLGYSTCPGAPGTGGYPDRD
jgi:hypothetical protein